MDQASLDFQIGFHINQALVDINILGNLVTISPTIPVKKIWFSKPLSRQGCPLPHSGLKATRGAVNGSVGAFTNRNWRFNGEK